MLSILIFYKIGSYQTTYYIVKKKVVNICLKNSHIFLNLSLNLFKFDEHKTDSKC